ncbi:uncharacterized protein TNCV_1527401 [Trichonephila clavipes]|nr:uncharacterized protein TNCV_1527401 [Trichonephila clavipes]
MYLGKQCQMQSAISKSSAMMVNVQEATCSICSEIRFASCLFNNMTSETVEVARIALRLPPFWKSNVRLWIAQCDHAFTFSGISSDDTKYSALVANLDAETLSYVSDIVLSPPNSDKYHTLSQRLITQFSDSETQKIKKLLTDLQLGDEKPSHLLRK